MPSSVHRRPLGAWTWLRGLLLATAAVLALLCLGRGVLLLAFSGLAFPYLLGLALPLGLAPLAWLAGMYRRSPWVAAALLGALTLAELAGEAWLIVGNCAHLPCATVTYIGMAVAALRLPAVKWMALASACLLCAGWLGRPNRQAVPDPV